MGILLSVLVLATIVIWYLFGYVWDYPLKEIRAASLSRLNGLIVATLSVTFVYLYFPNQTSSLFDYVFEKIFGTKVSQALHLSNMTLGTISTTLTFVLSFIYYYASNENAEILRTKKHHGLSKCIQVLLYVYTASILFLFCTQMFEMHITLSAIIAVWLGFSMQIIIKMETDLFREATKRNYP